MNKESVFSPEYEINNTTGPLSLIQDKSSASKDEIKDEFTDQIKSSYNLSKPRRHLIRAKIITK